MVPTRGIELVSPTPPKARDKRLLSEVPDRDLEEFRERNERSRRNIRAILALAADLA